MKHLKKFNESNDVINNILNIARDEELDIITPQDCRTHGFIPIQYYIDRYPMDNYGNPIKSAGAIMSNEKFIVIIKEIYDRLINEGLVDVRERDEDEDERGYNRNSFFYVSDNDFPEDVTKITDFTFKDQDMGYAGITLNI